MRMRSLIAFLALPALATVATGQNSTIQGPGGGFVFDAAAGAIRPVIGIPGASYLGPPVLSGLSLAAVAPDGKRALVAGQDGMRFIADLRDVSNSARILPGTIENPDRAVWGAGSTAVLYSAQLRQLQFLRDEGAGLVPGAPCDLSSLRSPVSLLAADPDAGVAAVAASSEGRLTIYLIREGVAPQAAITTGGPVAAAFGSLGTVLYLADAATSSIWVLRNLNGDIQAETFLETGDRMREPAALAVRSDRKLLYLADAACRCVRSYDIETRQLQQEWELDSAPSSLDLFSPTAFLVNARRQPKEPVWILETAPQAGVLFIPTGE